MYIATFKSNESLPNLNLRSKIKEYHLFEVSQLFLIYFMLLSCYYEFSKLGDYVECI